MSFAATSIELDGARKARRNLTRNRIRLAILIGLALFLVIGGRLVLLALEEVDDTISGQVRSALENSRPVLLDRNGIEMAMDLQAPSLFGEPRNIVDLDEAVEKLARVLPSLDPAFIRDRLDR